VKTCCSLMGPSANVVCLGAIFLSGGVGPERVLRWGTRHHLPGSAFAGGDPIRLWGHQPRCDRHLPGELGSRVPLPALSPPVVRLLRGTANRAHHGRVTVKRRTGEDLEKQKATKTSAGEKGRNEKRGKEKKGKKKGKRKKGKKRGGGQKRKKTAPARPGHPSRIVYVFSSP